MAKYISDRPYQPKNLMDIQIWEEQVRTAVMHLESNTEIMAALRKFYVGLQEKYTFSIDPIDLQSFEDQIGDMISDSKLQKARCELLLRITSDRKELVSFIHRVSSS